MRGIRDNEHKDLVLERHKLIRIPEQGSRAFESEEECETCGNWVLKEWEVCQWCGEELK